MKELTTVDLRIRGEWAHVPNATQDELSRQYGAHHATNILWLYGIATTKERESKEKPVKRSAEEIVAMAKAAIESSPVLENHAPGVRKVLA